MTQRKIIHCDCDCFFAAVEMRDDPSLREIPFAVGGASDRRGVVATCNYVARAFGVRSAMPTAHAKRLCPDLIIVPPRFPEYRQAAMQIRAIFHSYTDLVEPLSLDEAFLDVSDVDMCRGSATLIAKEIRQRIEQEVGVTASAGIAPNKFIAKIASDMNKPNGQKVVTPSEVDAFVNKLPVNKIFGVGKVTARNLANLGIETCAQLRGFELLELVEKFGKFGRHLFELSRGIDNRPVVSEHQRKSLSVENTFATDLLNIEQCQQQLGDLVVELRQRLHALDNRYHPTRLYLKIKFNDFTTTTIERALIGTVGLSQCRPLLTEAWERGNRPVRLLGVGVKLLDKQSPGSLKQLSLFEERYLAELHQLNSATE